ncbi:clostri-philic family protein [Clostridium taeniosporum]|nr:clostri-philic family protein [Clostridium taeniosporum]
MVHKEGSINPMQKGKRRQKLNENQNNVGDAKKPSYYKNFNGEPIE